MKQKKPKTEEQLLKARVRRRTLVSFSIFIIAILAAIAGWKWLYSLGSDDPAGAGLRKPVRTVLDKNEQFFSGLFSNRNLSKTYSKKDAVKNVRVNGDIGMNDADTTNWKLHLVRDNGDTLLLTLNDIKALPKTEEIFDFKCIEGWDQVTHWGGVRLSDFMKHYGLGRQAAMKYVALSTPDNGYYVGIDMASALHPQPILCYEMNGKPLPLDQGYPLRLIIPVKYGIKHLKRIGTMYFSNKRPPDYWTEQGYDYYSGL
jgi:DMSO/TMAO reductase YedYZ molybdopterin-dependent catalytic subunit